MSDAHADPALLARAIAGDPEAAGALWHRHRRWVAACALAHLADTAELDDVLQETALQMWRGLGELRDADSFRPWLRRIAVNAAHSVGRRSGVRQRHLRTLDEVERDFERAHREAREVNRVADDLADVLTRIRELPPHYREPLLLKAIDGLSQREIGAVLDVAETTIETRLARARRMLRERVDVDQHDTNDCHDASIRRAVD